MRVDKQMAPNDDDRGPRRGQRLVAIGECMLELSPADADHHRLGFGGDTLNTAVYLARLGVAVAYATALGDDPNSDQMVAAWQAEGIDTTLVVRLAGRLPGLYLIRNESDGERAFFYWRDQAAARQLFTGSHAAAVIDAVMGYDWLYLSGITLSIYDTAGRAALMDLLRCFRAAGGRVAFDSNYRPRGWPDAAAARQAMAAVLAHVDLALPTLEDEQALFGDTDAAACADRIARAGVAEVAVKQGARGCLIGTAGAARQVPVATPVAAIDTTAAGDAFNAGYLAARLAGLDAVAAAAAGQRLAMVVITQRGAIIPRDAMPGMAVTP